MRASLASLSDATTGRRADPTQRSCRAPPSPATDEVGGEGMGELAETFGRRVKALRTLAGMSQAQLAEASHVSEEWVRRIERGAGSPSFDVIESLAQALHVTAAELFTTLPSVLPKDDTLVVAYASLTPREREWVISAAMLALSRPGRATE